MDKKSTSQITFPIKSWRGKSDEEFDNVILKYVHKYSSSFLRRPKEIDEISKLIWRLLVTKRQITGEVSLNMCDLLEKIWTLLKYMNKYT